MFWDSRSGSFSRLGLGNGKGRVRNGGRGSQESDNEQARREFVAWFDEVKKSRVGERVRVCSAEERKARLNYNMALVKG